VANFSEREYGAFQRSFRLPVDANTDAVTADFKNGVLTVTIPKVGPTPDRSRKIQSARTDVVNTVAPNTRFLSLAY
jgi:HSP20 family protein